VDQEMNRTGVHDVKLTKNQQKVKKKKKKKKTRAEKFMHKLTVLTLPKSFCVSRDVLHARFNTQYPESSSKMGI
jgi:hypothetical protein